MDSVDERQEQSRRRQDQCNGSDERSRLGSTGPQSSGGGFNSNQAPDSDCARRNSIGQNRLEKREAALGGILSQLKQLQQAHLAYVKAHEERLLQRLNDNREHQKQVLERMKVLEDEVIDYIEQLNDSESEPKKAL